MPSQKLLSAGTVCLLTFTLGATLAHAEPAARHHHLRAGRFVDVAVSRPGAARPMTVRFAARPVRRLPVVRAPAIVPVIPVVRYRPYRYRPGFSVGVYFGSTYGPYRNPYAYPYPFPYPAPAYGPRVWVAYGGVRLQVTPRDATVYVDGYYVGIVDDFDGTLQHAALAAGPHQVEIRAPGYETLTFDVNVLPNQIIRYQGDLLPVRP